VIRAILALFTLWAAAGCLEAPRQDLRDLHAMGHEVVLPGKPAQRREAPANFEFAPGEPRTVLTVEVTNLREGVLEMHRHARWSLPWALSQPDMLLRRRFHGGRTTLELPADLGGSVALVIMEFDNLEPTPDLGRAPLVAEAVLDRYNDEVLYLRLVATEGGEAPLEH